MTTVGLVGCGHLGTIIARALCAGKAEDCTLVGLVGRTNTRADALAAECGCRSFSSLEELLALRPDYVIEAATGDALKSVCIPALQAGSNIICLSVGAFFDEDFYAAAAEAARSASRHVYLASGVIGGFDILSTAALIGGSKASLTKRRYRIASPKCPPGLRDMPEHLSGSVREVYPQAPSHLNIGVALGLACGSLDTTQLHVEPVEDDDYMSFTIEAEGPFGRTNIYTQQGGPGCEVRGPDFAAWSAVSLLRRLTAPITF